jgi:hypothetical protein
MRALGPDIVQAAVGQLELIGSGSASRLQDNVAILLWRSSP